jgi:hypothetical protein
MLKRIEAIEETLNVTRRKWPHVLVDLPGATPEELEAAVAAAMEVSEMVVVVIRPAQVEEAAANGSGNNGG